MVIELRVVQFWSEIILVISNFEITRMISDQIALHSVQLPLFMVTRDVLKVLKLHSPTARAILRTFKTSLVLINPEMHSRSYDFLYLLSIPPDYLAALPRMLLRFFGQPLSKQLYTFSSHCTRMLI